MIQSVSFSPELIANFHPRLLAGFWADALAHDHEQTYDLDKGCCASLSEKPELLEKPVTLDRLTAKSAMCMLVDRGIANALQVDALAGDQAIILRVAAELSA